MRGKELLPRLHVVTDDSVLGRGGFEASARDVLAAGGPDVALHLRGPGADGSTLFSLAEALLPAARRSGTLLFVNDRIDVALAVGTDGAHVGQRSLGVRVARELLGAGRWLGASVHGAAEAREAEAEGADYAFLGTIFPTPSHPEQAGMGLEGLAAVVGGAKSSRIVAIGGIDLARAADVLGAGAYGIAAVRGIWDSRDPAAAVGDYKEAIASALATSTR